MLIFNSILRMPSPGDFPEAPGMSCLGRKIPAEDMENIDFPLPCRCYFIIAFFLPF